MRGDLIDFLLSYVNTTDVVVTIVALTLTLLATYYLAWQATIIQPAQVLGQL